MKRKQPKQKPSKKTYCDPERFMIMRKTAGMTKQQCADHLFVSLRTIHGWEGGYTRIPYSAYKLMRMQVNGGLLDKQWDYWTVRGDFLWSPDGRSWQQCELYYISNYISMARYWLADQQKKADARKAAKKRRDDRPFKVIDGGNKW